jgi:hypothetical protein
MQVRRHPLAVLGCAFALGSALAAPLGCENVPGNKNVARLPGTRTSFVVAFALDRGPYIDALLERSNTIMRLLFPPSEVCRRLITVDNAVDWVTTGPIGRVRVGDEICDPVGIAGLNQWRDRRRRAPGGPLQRSRSTFTQVFQDRDVTMVRGRFPFTGAVGFSGGHDVVALLPRNDVCDAVAEQGVASIEFRVVGRDAITLLHQGSRCAIEGFAQPLSPR